MDSGFFSGFLEARDTKTSSHVNKIDLILFVSSTGTALQPQFPDSSILHWKGPLAGGCTLKIIRRFQISAVSKCWDWCD